MMAISRTLVCLAYLLVAVGAAPAKFTCDCGLVNESHFSTPRDGIYDYMYPMVVLVMDIEQKLPLCVGTIITSRHILTVTNCTVKGPSKTRIWVPASSSEYIVEDMITHEGYNKVTGEHNIVIIVTWVTMTFKNFVGPVCMPIRKLYLPEKEVLALGWGKTGKFARMFLHVRRNIEGYMCKNNREDLYIPRSMFCTSGIGETISQDFVGGPMMREDPETKRYTLVGIVVSGGNREVSEPSLNTDVSAYIPWINQKIAEVEPRVKLCTIRLNN